MTTAIQYEVVVPNSELGSVLSVTNDKSFVAAVANSARVVGTATISASDLRSFQPPTQGEASAKSLGMKRSVSGTRQPTTPGLGGLVLATAVSAVQTLYG